MDHRVIGRLSESSECRAVDLLQNGQIALCWDRTVLRMRTVDLVVLNNALRSWAEEHDRDGAQMYTLSFNSYTMFVGNDDLYRFCAMVDEATEQLPRRIVRWIDLDIRIVPFTAAHHKGIPCFSPN